MAAECLESVPANVCQRADCEKRTWNGAPWTYCGMDCLKSDQLTIEKHIRDLQRELRDANSKLRGLQAQERAIASVQHACSTGSELRVGRSKPSSLSCSSLADMPRTVPEHRAIGNTPQNRGIGNIPQTRAIANIPQGDCPDSSSPLGNSSSFNSTSSLFDRSMGLDSSSSVGSDIFDSMGCELLRERSQSCSSVNTTTSDAELPQLTRLQPRTLAALRNSGRKSRSPSPPRKPPAPLEAMPSRAARPAWTAAFDVKADTPEGVGTECSGLGSTVKPKLTQTLEPFIVEDGQELKQVGLPSTGSLRFSRRVFHRVLELVDRCQHTTLAVISCGSEQGGISVNKPLEPAVAAFWTRNKIGVFDELPQQALEHWSKAAVVVHPVSGKINTLTVPIDVCTDKEFDVSGGSRAMYAFSAARGYSCIAVHKKITGGSCRSLGKELTSVFSSAEMTASRPIFYQCQGPTKVLLDRKLLNAISGRNPYIDALQFVELLQHPCVVPGFDIDGAPVWHKAWNRSKVLPAKCEEQVVNATLKMASTVATKGLGEKVPAKGFLIIIGDRARLMDGSLGTFGKHNKYAHAEISVLSMDEEDMTYVLPDFGMDKAMIICGTTGQILANKFAVSNIQHGDCKQGTKHQAASAIAQEGFLAIKCSEDSCSVDGRAAGKFRVFPGTKSALGVIVRL